MGCIKLDILDQERALEVNPKNFLRVVGKNGPAEKNRLSSYTYGFQGQEMDNELKGTGNSVNYKFRMHDPRLGRFFAIDPLRREYPFLSTYQFSSNSPIGTKEIEGLEGDPLAWIAAGFAEYFDAIANVFTFEASASLNVTRTNSKSSTGTTTTTNQTVYTVSASTSYDRWTIFQAGSYCEGCDNSIPWPEFSGGTKVTVTNETEIKTSVTPNSTVSIKTSIDIKTGETTNAASSSATVVAPGRVPVTVDLSHEQSNSGSTSTSAKVAVGSTFEGGSANVYVKAKSSTSSDGSSSGTVVVGAEVKAQSPTINKWSVGVAAKVEAGVKTD